MKLDETRSKYDDQSMTNDCFYIEKMFDPKMNGSLPHVEHLDSGGGIIKWIGDSNFNTPMVTWYSLT